MIVHTGVRTQSLVQIIDHDRSAGIAVITVAVCLMAEGEVFDWAAYIGSTQCGEDEREADVYWQHVAERGTKLPFLAAKTFYPSLPAERWRA